MASTISTRSCTEAAIVKGLEVPFGKTLHAHKRALVAEDGEAKAVKGSSRAKQMAPAVESNWDRRLMDPGQCPGSRSSDFGPVQ